MKRARRSSGLRRDGGLSPSTLKEKETGPNLEGGTERTKSVAADLPVKRTSRATGTGETTGKSWERYREVNYRIPTVNPHPRGIGRFGSHERPQLKRVCNNKKSKLKPLVSKQVLNT